MRTSGGSRLVGAWERLRLLTESAASGHLMNGHSDDLVSTRLSAYQIVAIDYRADVY